MAYSRFKNENCSLFFKVVGHQNPSFFEVLVTNCHIIPNDLKGDYIEKLGKMTSKIG